MIVLKYISDFISLFALRVIQMMKGATEEQRQEWEMPRDQKFTWLPNAEKTLEGFCFIISFLLTGMRNVWNVIWYLKPFPLSLCPFSL